MSCFDRPNCVLWSILSLYGVFLVIFSVPLWAEESSPLKDRFLKEAPSAWEEYRAYADRLQGTTEDVCVLVQREQELCL